MEGPDLLYCWFPSFACPLLVLSFPVLCTSALHEKLWCCLGLTMASSSERGAARALGAPPGPPPPEELAAFYAPVEKQITACVLSRHMRAAELSERAAKHADRLWGDNSLMVAHLRVGEVFSLRGMANASTSSSEQEALRRRAWEILASVHALLLRRLADNTLLPGTIQEEEVTYYTRSQAFVGKAQAKTVPPEAVLQGQVFILDTKRGCTPCFIRWICSWCSALPRESAHSFVLTALDATPRTATMQHRLPVEAALVTMMDTHMKPQNLEPA